MATFTVPTSVVHPTTGETIPMPGHASFVAGTDITDAFRYWLTLSIGTDGYSSYSGSPGARNTLLLQPEAVYPVWYGTDWGARTDDTAKTDDTGRVWPKVIAHAHKHLIIDGQDATLQNPDNSKFDAGLIETSVADVTNSQLDSVCVTNITPPLTPTQVARVRSGVTKIHGTAPDQTGNVFGGGGQKNWAVVSEVADDGTYIRIATTQGSYTVVPGSTTWTATPISINTPSYMTRRQNGFNMLTVSSPGGWGGVERACVTKDLIFRNLTIDGGNTAFGDAVGTDREEWLGIAVRISDGVTFEDSVNVVNIWSDTLNLRNNSQANTDLDVSMMAENLTFNAKCNGAGRHAITDHGSVNLLVDRATFGNIEHWGYDSEPTNAGSRMLNATIRSSAFDPGISLQTAHPPGFLGEPPIEVDITQGTAANRIVVPYDAITNDHIGSRITGTGIPDDTFTLRRMSPTEIELSQDVSLSGTVASVVGPWSWFRGMTWDRCAVWAANPCFVNDQGPLGSKVYFTADTTQGSNILTNVVFEDRADGLTYTTSQFTGRIAASGAGNVIAAGTPTSTTSTTVTMPANAAKTLGAKTFTGVTVTAHSRTMSSPTAQFVATDVGRRLTGTGLQEPTRIDQYVNGKTVLLSRAAESTSTGSYSSPGPTFYARLGPSDYQGWTIDRLRNIGRGGYGGSLPSRTVPGEPMILLPNRTTDSTVTRCFAPAKTQGHTTTTQSVADVASLPTDLNVAAIGAFNNTGTIRVPTSAGFALISYTARGTVPNRLRNLTLISGSGSIANGADVDSVSITMVGYWDGTATHDGGRSGDTITNNRWENALDTQMNTPTVTCSLTLSGTSLSTARPDLTVVASFSDSTERDGEAVTFLRNGVIRGVGILDGDTATFTPWTDSPLPGPHLWTAEWAGSYNTLSAESNTVTQYPAASVVPTTITLEPEIPSPQVEGTPVGLLVTLTPEIPYVDAGEVIFRDNDREFWRMSAGFSGVNSDVGMEPTAGLHHVTVNFTGVDAQSGGDAYGPSVASIEYAITPLSPDDTTAPTITARSPEAGTQAVNRRAAVTFTLSETSTLTRCTVRAHDLVIPGTLTHSGNDYTWTPDVQLAPRTTYTVTVDQAEDSSGNVMVPDSWSFTTARRSPVNPPGPAHPRVTAGRETTPYQGPLSSPAPLHTARESRAVFPDPPAREAVAIEVVED